MLATVREFRTASSRAGLTVLTEAETRKRLGAAPDSSLAEIDRLIASARFDYFNEGSGERASRTLRAALDQLRSLPPSEARWKDIRDVRIMLGQIASRAGDTASAREHFEAIYRVDSEMKLDENQHSPALRHFAEAVRQEVRRQRVASLQLSSSGEPVEVFVEGRPFGRTPLTVLLPAGRYWVQAGLEGGRGGGRFVQLVDEETLEFNPSHERLILGDKGPCLETGSDRETRLRALARVGGQLGVSRLIAIRFEEPNPGERYVVAGVVEAPSGNELREGRVHFRNAEKPDEAAERLLQFLSTGEAVKPVEPIVRRPVGGSGATLIGIEEARASRVRARRTTGLVIGGAGLATLVAGTVTYVQAQGMPHRHEAWYEGRNGKLVQSVTFTLIGATALAGGVYIYATADESSVTRLSVAPLSGGGGQVALSGLW